MRYLSRKSGALTAAMGVLGTLPREERPAYGKAANEVKPRWKPAFAERQDALKAAALEAELAAGTGGRDAARPAGQRSVICTSPRRRCASSTRSSREMGFEVYEAPDVEMDDYNFGLLNIPQYHPARDMWDTFWVKETGEGPGRPPTVAARTPRQARCA